MKAFNPFTKRYHTPSTLERSYFHVHGVLIQLDQALYEAGEASDDKQVKAIERQIERWTKALHQHESRLGWYYDKHNHA